MSTTYHQWTGRMAKALRAMLTRPPWVDRNLDGGSYCYFCGAAYRDGHVDTCAYERARQLMRDYKKGTD